MRLLLDTHVVLWALSDDERLGDSIRDLITSPANDALVSVVSLWEIAVKARIGKLDAHPVEVWDAVEQAGFELLDIQRRHVAALSGLVTHHRDPFDHLLIAQAIAEKAVLISDDRQIARYDVRVLGCQAA